MVTCDDLVAFVDGELEERADEFREHMRCCASCRKSLVECVQLAARLSELPLPPSAEHDDLALAHRRPPQIPTIGVMRDTS